MSTKPEIAAAASALKQIAPSNDEVREMMQFLCGYSPNGMHAALEHVVTMRGLIPDLEGNSDRIGPDGYPGDAREPAWMTDPDRDDGEIAFAEEYVRQHGNDDLETGHTRDPKGDEAAHS